MALIELSSEAPATVELAYSPLSELWMRIHSPSPIPSATPQPCVFIHVHVEHINLKGHSLLMAAAKQSGVL